MDAVRPRPVLQASRPGRLDRADQLQPHARTDPLERASTVAEHDGTTCSSILSVKKVNVVPDRPAAQSPARPYAAAAFGAPHGSSGVS